VPKLRLRLRLLICIAGLLAGAVIGRMLLTGDESLEGLSPDEARIERLRRRGDVAALAEEVGSHQPKVAVLAVRALASLAPGSLPHLETAMEQPRPEVREAAAISLAQAGGRGKGALLAEATNDESAKVRAAAVTGLGQVRAFDQMPALLAALEDDSLGVRRRAAEAITRITGIDFNFRADAPLDQRQRAAAQFRTLWELVKEDIRKRYSGG
jgi:HEAT repeat protein